MGGACRTGRHPEQGRQPAADGTVPGTGPGVRRARRTGRHIGPAQQRAAAAWLGLGCFRRGSAYSDARLPRLRVSRSGLRPRRCRTPRTVRGSGGTFRECVFPDAGLAAARRRREPCRRLAAGECPRSQHQTSGSCLRLCQPRRPADRSARRVHAGNRVAL